MRRIDVELEPNGYPIYLGSGLFTPDAAWLDHLSPGKILVVTNEVVAPLYLDSLRAALGEREAEILVVPDGEQHKTAETWLSVLDRLVEMGARRDCNLVALGGGVIGDMTGYAAASYMRGVRFVQIPTTLLAQVDASVGGKTGVNHPRGKNLIGAFHQPATVVIDTDTLETLEAREYAAGLAEVVKYGAICDADFLAWIEEHVDEIRQRDSSALEYMISVSVRCKADIVAQDERESGVRALLNFGHTFGHAIETETAYKRYLHGEAVAIGMVTASRLSELRGLCPGGSARRLESLLSRLDLPVGISADLDATRLASAMLLDKKATHEGMRLILLKELGQAFIDRGSSDGEIRTAIETTTDSN